MFTITVLYVSLDVGCGWLHHQTDQHTLPLRLWVPGQLWPSGHHPPHRQVTYQQDINTSAFTKLLQRQILPLCNCAPLTHAVAATNIAPSRDIITDMLILLCDSQIIRHINILSTPGFDWCDQRVIMIITSADAVIWLQPLPESLWGKETDRVIKFIGQHLAALISSAEPAARWTETH